MLIDLSDRQIGIIISSLFDAIAKLECEKLEYPPCSEDYEFIEKIIKNHKVIVEKLNSF